MVPLQKEEIKREMREGVGWVEKKMEREEERGKEAGGKMSVRMMNAIEIGW